LWFAAIGAGAQSATKWILFKMMPGKEAVQMTSEINRRTFLEGAAAATAFTIVPRA